jgi:NACHT domain
MNPKEPEDTDLLPLLIKLAAGYLSAYPSQSDREKYRKALIDSGMAPDSVDLLLNEPNNLGRQPDPQPSLETGEASPSLLLYAALLAFAVVLIVLGFNIKESNWASLALNLATEIIGAVLILIIVDKRLRNDELQAIHKYANSSSIQLSSVFIADIRDTVSYAKALSFELKRIQPKDYIERAKYESLLESHPGNLILHGVAGCGKSTLFQSLALRQAERVKHQPRSKIPIIFPIRRWDGNEITNQLWQTFQGFSKMKSKKFHKWLQQGRFIIMLDALDESRESRSMLEEIRRFSHVYPKITVLASCRSNFLTDAESILGFPAMELSGLSETEAKELIQKLLKEEHG